MMIGSVEKGVGKEHGSAEEDSANGRAHDLPRRNQHPESPAPRQRFSREDYRDDGPALRRLVVGVGLSWLLLLASSALRPLPALICLETAGSSLTASRMPASMAEFPFVAWPSAPSLP